MASNRVQFTPETARHFDRFSIANAVAVKQALPCGCEPYRDVFTYLRWKAQGFQVQRGQKAIRLPLVYGRSETDPETGERRTVKRLGRSAVFCRCQVARIGSDGAGAGRVGEEPERYAATAVREVVVRYRGSARRVGEVVRGPAEAVRFVRQLIANDAREHFVALLLDGRHRAIGYQVVSVGTATASLVHPREVFQGAIGLGACAVVVAHNHPSGDLRLSREDVEITQRLASAGELLGIPLLDSLVVADRGHVSIREERPEAFKAAS